MQQSELKATRCAICKTYGNSQELYPANFDDSVLNPTVFSARRLPDQIHFRLVKCHKCGLVRSDPIVPADILAQLYKQSSFTYSDETADLRRTYGHYLAKLESIGGHKATLLEIGCGNGFFLEEALSQGYETVHGVEPSQEASKQAQDNVRSQIICDILRPGLFAPSQFDAVCLFQVLDHLPDPSAILNECLTVLKPGGLILCLNHNIGSLSARILRERSPIVDIEHTYLFSTTTMREIFKTAGFDVKTAAPVWNLYSLHYIFRLLPLPPAIKNSILGILKRHAVGRLRLWLPLGNVYLIAQKPRSQA